MQRISVAICTRARARLLEGALASLCRAHPPRQSEWEVLVVLNDCVDDSPRVVDRFRDRLPIVCVAEAVPGLSHARNRAIDTAAGDVIAWIDDDVEVDADWLRAYEGAFLRWPDASVFGGAILPKFEGTPPDWLQQAGDLCGAAFAARPVPEADAPILLDDELPFGANFAVRMLAQRQFRYHPGLGQRPGKWIVSGEEVEVIRWILAGGSAGRWVRGATVQHIMPQARQTIEYVRYYYASSGRLMELRARRSGFRPSSADRLRDLVTMNGAQAWFRLLKTVAGPRQWVPTLVTAAIARGKWIGRHQRDTEAASGMPPAFPPAIYR
jgi:hypothetical protein